MTVKLESQFKHRDERILNALRRRRAHDVRKPLIDRKVRGAQTWFTLAFGEAITIATAAKKSGDASKRFNLGIG